MISVEEALNKINLHQKKGTPVLKKVKDCLGYITAENIHSPINMPPFRQSAMDGYAVALHNSNRYTLTGEVKAGDAPDYKLEPGQAVRIFTGAAVPNTANAVIMQEKTSVKNNQLVINESPKKEQNIRPEGEQIKKRELVLAKNSKLNPAALSYITSLGIEEVFVYPQPRISIIITGSELIQVGTPYVEGKIYESNSIMLKATLEQQGITNVKIHTIKDSFKSTKTTLDSAIQTSDFVLVSGGISVGDYDFTGKALKELRTEELFYRIKQKPGKPLYFGKNGNTYIFALPGNPASALTCFYIYALPLLKSFCGNSTIHLERTTKQLTHEYTVKGIRAQFLKAKVTDDNVEILGLQSSAMVHGFINANALVYLPENSVFIKKNSKVEVILLP